MRSQQDSQQDYRRHLEHYIPPPPRSLAALGLSKKQWEDLEGKYPLREIEIISYAIDNLLISAASEKALPRFLFRGFGPDSGGDSRLNTTTRITPHAFIDGKQPTTIYDIPDLRGVIERHVSNKKGMSEFSSWTACLTVASR